MASYHRVLEAFGRAVSDNDIQCDLDIHPWDISINKQQWSGKIRLVGFIDIFFLLCYTNNSRIEKGIIIYKYQDNVDELCTRSNIPVKFRDDRHHAPASAKQAETAGAKAPESPGAPPAYTPTDSLPPDPSSPAPRDAPGTPDKKPGDLLFSKDSTFYKAVGRGHEIGLKLRYPDTAWATYDIEIRKSSDPLKNRRIKRGLKKHDTLDLTKDSAKIGVIAVSEAIGHATGHVLMGGFVEDATRKYVEGATSVQRSNRMTLSGDS